MTVLVSNNERVASGRQSQETYVYAVEDVIDDDEDGADSELDNAVEVAKILLWLSSIDNELAVTDDVSCVSAYDELPDFDGNIDVIVLDSLVLYESEDSEAANELGAGLMWVDNSNGVFLLGNNAVDFVVGGALSCKSKLIELPDCCVDAGLLQSQET